MSVLEGNKKPMHIESADSRSTATEPAAHASALAESAAASPGTLEAASTGPHTYDPEVIEPDNNVSGVDSEVSDHLGEFNDNDSAISTDFISETTSLKSRITAYREEHGRRYHAYKDGSYFFPNDEKQNEQLDIGLILDGKLFIAPISEHPQKVLDLGTGTGIWAIDFADQFPSAYVIGTDLSPTQPLWVPPNVRFEIEDYNDDWTFKKNEFDFIHLRNLYGSVKDWPRLYKQAYDRLKPGGWIEQYEISIKFQSDDGTVKPDTALWRFNELAMLLSERIGKSFTICEEMKGHIDTAGFVNIKESVWKAPHGPWPADPRMKEIGNWGYLELSVGLEGFCMALLTRILGWSYEKVQVHIARILAELRSRDIHSYHYIHAVYGQKPENV